MGAPFEDGGFGDPLPDSGAAYIFRNRAQAAELTITKTVTPTGPLALHSAVTYTLAIANTGAVSDTALLSDTLPTQVDFGAWIERPLNAEASDNTLTWSGEIAAGATITLNFSANHVGLFGDVVTNTAAFSGTLQSGEASAVFTVQAAHTYYMPMLVRGR